MPPSSFSYLQSNQDLAKELKVNSTSYLTNLSYTSAKHYKTYRIPKRTPGEFRTIYDPDQTLRTIQYRLLKSIWEKVPVMDECYAFESGKSIPQMANLHVNKAVVLSYDIRKYFDHIKNTMLMDVLTEHGMGPVPARTVAELCTYTYFVPQGALTSPKISNCISSSTFGPGIKQFCEERGLTLTIYADDITISGQTIPNIHEVNTFVARQVEQFGFRINTRKTKVMTRKTRQWVCGVVVNEKTNMLRKERKILRAIVHNVEKNGIEIEAQKCLISPEGFVKQTQGRLNWFKQLNAVQGGILWDKWISCTRSTSG